MGLCIKIKVLAGGGDSFSGDRFGECIPHPAFKDRDPDTSGVVKPFVAVTLLGQCSSWTAGSCEKRTTSAKVGTAYPEWNEELTL